MNTDIRLIDLFFQINRRLGRRLWSVGDSDKLATADLMILWKLTCAGSLRASDLAAAIGLPGSTLTGMLDRLSAQGYVERRESAEDRRSVVLAPTPRAIELIELRKTTASGFLNTAFDAMPPEQRDRLAEDLSAVLAGLDKKDDA